jgi:hypothetical protein
MTGSKASAAPVGQTVYFNLHIERCSIFYLGFRLTQAQRHLFLLVRPGGPTEDRAGLRQTSHHHETLQMFRHVLEHLLLICLLSVVSSDFGKVRENQSSLKVQFGSPTNGREGFSTIEESRAGNQHLGIKPTFALGKISQRESNPSTSPSLRFREKRNSLDSENSGQSTAPREASNRDRPHQPLRIIDVEQQTTRATKNHVSNESSDDNGSGLQYGTNFPRNVVDEYGNDLKTKVTASDSDGLDPALPETSIGSIWTRAGAKHSQQQQEDPTSQQRQAKDVDGEIQFSTAVLQEPGSVYESNKYDRNSKPNFEQKSGIDSSSLKIDRQGAGDPPVQHFIDWMFHS